MRRTPRASCSWSADRCRHERRPYSTRFKPDFQGVPDDQRLLRVMHSAAATALRLQQDKGVGTVATGTGAIHALGRLLGKLALSVPGLRAREACGTMQLTR